MTFCQLKDSMTKKYLCVIPFGLLAVTFRETQVVQPGCWSPLCLVNREFTDLWVLAWLGPTMLMVVPHTEPSLES